MHAEYCDSTGQRKAVSLTVFLFSALEFTRVIKPSYDGLLSLTDTPEPPVITGLSAATEGQLVTLNCSVSYHCPSVPPTLRWIWERGTPWNDSEPGEVQTLLLDAHRPMLLTSLSFIATHKVKPRFRCEVRHPGGNALATSKNLHVTCEHRFDEHICASLPSLHYEISILSPPYFHAVQFLLKTWWSRSTP